MSSHVRSTHSPYMHWAKTRFQSQPRFGLTNSGVMNYPISELQVRLEDIDLSGPSYYGYPPLQEALARHTKAPVESIVAAQGTSGANYLAMAALLEPGDDCLVESPVYDPLLHAASSLGARINRFRRHAEDGFRIRLDEVRQAMTPATRLIVISNLHNPSSAFIDETTLRGLAAIARESNARVLVDEVYLEAMYEDAPPSAFFLDPVFVITSSLTKAYGLSGLRCGWILAEPDLARRLWLLNDLMGVIPAHSAERLSILALEQLPAIAARARRILDPNRALLHAFLEKHPRLQGGRIPHGTVSFPRLPGVDVDAFCARLLEHHGVSVVPGSFFEAPEHLRITIGCATETLRGGLDGLAAALAELDR